MARFRADAVATTGEPLNALLNVVIGQHERQTGETTICSFDITLADADASATVERLASEVVKRDDTPIIRSAGENALIPFILHGGGHGYLKAQTLDLFPKLHKVSDLSADDALGMAVDIIEAAARIVADPRVVRPPGPPPIGGPTDAVLLAGNGAGPQRLRWKAE
jgi:hypothetical protein